MTRFSGIGGGFSGYSAISRSFVTASVTSEYSGSTMLFVQASAPTGWVQDTTYNDYALRVTSGTAGTGGATNFSSVFTTVTPTGTTSPATLGSATGGVTLSTALIPNHSHAYIVGGPVFGGTNLAPTINRSAFNPNTATGDVTPTSSTGQPHSHPAGNSVSTSFVGSSINMAVKYIDCILATRS